MRQIARTSIDLSKLTETLQGLVWRFSILESRKSPTVHDQGPISVRVKDPQKRDTRKAVHS